MFYVAMFVENIASNHSKTAFIKTHNGISSSYRSATEVLLQSTSCRNCIFLWSLRVTGPCPLLLEPLIASGQCRGQVWTTALRYVGANALLYYSVSHRITLNIRQGLESFTQFLGFKCVISMWQETTLLIATVTTFKTNLAGNCAVLVQILSCSYIWTINASVNLFLKWNLKWAIFDRIYIETVCVFFFISNLTSFTRRNKEAGHSFWGHFQWTNAP